MSKTRFSACLASLSLAVVIQASDSALHAQSALADAPQASASIHQGIAERIAPLGEEAKTLRAQATQVTRQIGALASAGELPTSQEAVQTLQELVKELAKINERLEKMQEDIDGLQDSQKEALPAVQNDVKSLQKFTWSNYVQFQYSDNQSNASATRPNDGFALRRVRLSTTGKLDPKTSMKVSVDLATGNRRTSAEVKDVILKYDILSEKGKPTLDLRAGQQSMPLGYEIERSSSEREFPERAQYNQRLWSGERNRGAYLTYGLDKSWTLHGGLWNALSVSDPQQTEQDTFRNLSGTRMAGHLGLRYTSPELKAGISGFLGYRSDFSFTPTGGSTVNVPSGQRQFVYVDAAYTPKSMKNLTLRGEMMVGRDRVPQFSGSGASRSTSLEFDAVRGYHLQATYALNYRNAISARYEFFDPNVKANDNLSAWGLAYSYLINPGAKLTLAHEWLNEQGLDVTNNITTLRLQFKL